MDPVRIELTSAPCKGASFPLAYGPDFSMYSFVSFSFAEREGFEPSVGFHPRVLSKHVP